MITICSSCYDYKIEKVYTELVSAYKHDLPMYDTSSLTHTIKNLKFIWFGFFNFYMRRHEKS